MIQSLWYQSFKIFKGLLHTHIAVGLLGFLYHVLDNHQDSKLHDSAKFRYLNHFPIVQIWDSSYHFSVNMRDPIIT